ncbi:nicotinate-nucleotide--dimethylbenzimidazole phosphoribosyltransferase [Bermanella marisrubri]|uniref:Nicotinate-nucleotide--dimethylbenzimidazole phosphoribosyltransferase n=1 Tax=Bermanella marisrubri TaxID=207949 RepID=Q1MZQ9_9GAMM|nr:nicotinate-nucleotide--dimethylbenzimidazole phosphoribosyltransferase [Bermanella marisrubri]EAT11498.1 nicotinate-nucleotide--dimethylbenzimidazole phosphoribosyltransferase [Oceanobacter sp. RED65] [Bermanella marisrubri]QIZ85073.1 nicotinate-nucleotide--dimethylbenzimidazole phosphoribosyltransferase [Bermanella marisrubri]
MNWFEQPCRLPSVEFFEQAQAHQSNLTKPPGSLGQLEQVACQLSAMQERQSPSLDRIHISIFAADHGIAKQGVSAFPQSVTLQMISNFLAGGAAISVLAQQMQAELEVVNCGCNGEISDAIGLINKPIAKGTADFSIQPAMAEDELLLALQLGHEAADRAHQQNSDLFIGGEMGIANTSSATALAASQLGLPVADLVGPGTGVDAQQLQHKREVIDRAIARYDLATPLQRLQTFGGFEIAALCGAYIRAAQIGIPVLVDGFISSTAALMAVSINSSVRPWLIFSHAGAEPGHQVVLRALDASPLLSIGMRLGEGSGAAVVVSLLRSAVELHNSMATFADAGVDGKAS